MIYCKGIYKKCKYDSKSKCYKVWKDMLQRCYDFKLHEKYPTYRGCVVCNEWLFFENFVDWYDNNYVNGCQIDKDIIGNGKLYSPNTCCFVPNKINNLLHENTRKKHTSYPIGVHIQDGRYRVMINIGIGKKLHIGYFKNSYEAGEAYKIAKRDYVLSILNNFNLTSQVKSAIINKL